MNPYAHFIRAVYPYLRDVRGRWNSRRLGRRHLANGRLGFWGLRVTPEDWTTTPRSHHHWKRLAFKFFHRGQMHEVDLKV